MKIEQISGPEIIPHDVTEFESMLRYEDLQLFGDFGFEKSGKIIFTRAPARLDVMGGIADFFNAPVKPKTTTGPRTGLWSLSKTRRLALHVDQGAGATRTVQGLLDIFRWSAGSPRPANAGVGAGDPTQSSRGSLAHTACQNWAGAVPVYTGREAKTGRSQE